MGHWIIDTAGIGSLIAVGVALGVFGAYVRMLRWIQSAPGEEHKANDVQGDGE